jgi:hypothetical protein
MFGGNENLMEKWAPVLEHSDAPAIESNYKKAVTAKLLENQENALKESAAHSSFSLNEDTVAGDVQNFDPVLISLVRRAMPNLIAYDIAGVQPMSGPTGLIFAMKAEYQTVTSGVTAAGEEALFNEADTGYSGTGTHGGGDPFGGTDTTPDDGINDDFTTGAAMATATGEGDISSEMGFTIERSSVTANTRALKAEYTMELAQDLKAVHGLDAEAELANILSAEIMAEINREIVRDVNVQAVLGAANAGTQGAFDLSSDADGRWSAEKFKSLVMQIEIEANAIAKATRRGKGNFVIVSSDVASALAAAGVLDYSPAMSTALEVDSTGNTFAGMLNGRVKVYVDPYAAIDYCTVGYRGTNPYDAGYFYCPYVPLTMVRAVGQNDFQPKIGFKTRYGKRANPFVSGTVRDNTYFRSFKVENILTPTP